MPVRIIRRSQQAQPRLEPTADERGALVRLGETYLGRIVQVTATGNWLAYPPRYLVESVKTEAEAIAYLVQHKDKAGKAA